jgi:mRNA interferase RelE/StbE
VNGYQVALTTSAARELHKLPATAIARIVARLDGLALSPRPSGAKKLKGGDRQWRIRVGPYRVVYEN